MHSGESTFKSYVYGIARYTSLGFVKERMRYVDLPPDDLFAAQMGPEQSLVAAERVSLVANA